MEPIVIVGLIAAAYLYSTRNKAPATTAPQPGVPSAGGPLVSGGYWVGPPSIGNFGVVVSASAATGAQQNAIPLPTVLPWATPQFIGGIAGNVGTGGIPLGGVVRPGLTLGTATTVVGPSVVNSSPGSALPKISAIRPVVS